MDEQIGDTVVDVPLVNRLAKCCTDGSSEVYVDQITTTKTGIVGTRNTVWCGRRGRDNKAISPAVVTSRSSAPSDSSVCGGRY